MLDKLFGKEPKPKDPKKEQLEKAQKKGGFKKGYDPNRNYKGRPKKGETFDELLAEMMIEEDEKTGETHTVKMVRKKMKMAENGHIRASEYLLDRTYGKATERLEVTTKEPEEDLSVLTDEELEEYERLTAKVTKRNTD